METMNIAIPSRLKDFVQRRVEEGMYSSVSEYVRELIRIDQRKSAQAALEEELLKGLDSGPGEPVSAETWKRITEKAKQKRTPRKKN